MRNLLAYPDERVFFKDLDSRFLLVSAGFLSGIAQGLSLEEVIGKTDFDLFSRPHAVAAFEDEQRVLRTGQPMPAKLERETYHDRSDVWVSTTKLPLRDGDGRIIGTWGISRDVTAQVEAEEELVHQALHDGLTGVANRAALMDHLAQALLALERQPGSVGLLFVDLDDFKQVNDSLGHDAGDIVLSEVARRLRSIARRGDTVARFGGDEFVLLCPLGNHDDLRVVGDRMVHAIRAPMKVAETELAVTGSLGIALTTDSCVDPGELLRQADIALYEAKSAGRNRFEVFDAETHLGVESTVGLAGELAQALEHSELFVLYQPLFRLDNGALVGAEALVRWRHPQRGVLLPGEFLAQAERRGLIEQVDTFVLDEACRQLAEWGADDESWEDFTLSVNVSGYQLRDRGLVERVASALERHRIAASRLCLEVTETALIGELGAANQVLESLAELGVRIALDDFGTGYSTLAHLQQLHTDTLKIDRSFIAQLEGGSRDHDIVAAVIAMAHALGMTVVGEGVETRGQRDGLLALDCDAVQGYMFAPAIPPGDLAALRAAARTTQKQPMATAEARSAQRRGRARVAPAHAQDGPLARGH